VTIVECNRLLSGN